MSKEKGNLSLRRKLLIYLSLLLAAVLTFLAFLFGLTGILTQEDRQQAQLMDLHADSFCTDLEQHYELLAARGISLSESLSLNIQRILRDEELTPAKLNDNPDALLQVQSACYPALFQTLAGSRCSGAFFVLNATVNTQTDARSRSGLYLKKENISSPDDPNPRVAVFRGNILVARENNANLHSSWTLEASSVDLPYYDFVMQNRGERLAQSYFWAPTMPTLDTWERTSLLYVPLLDAEGQALGMCGLEISELYFKLCYSARGTPLEGGSYLIAPCSETGDLLYSRGLLGNVGSFMNLSDEMVLTPQPDRHLIRYAYQDKVFYGSGRSLQLSPLQEKDTDWFAVYLMPRELYLENLQHNWLIVILLSLFFLILFSILCLWMSRKYVEPILESIEAIKSGDNISRTNITEINDLMDFWRAQEEKRARALSGTGASDTASPVADLSAYHDFLSNIDTLSPAEQEVFMLYMEGCSARDIAQRLCLSINTVKTHNRHIYAKLNVGSLRELQVFIKMMKGQE